MDWAVPSERALKNGAYFKTKASACEVPAASLTAAGVSERGGQEVAAQVWFSHADRAAKLGVHLISVQKVTVRASPQSEDWRGVCSRGERKCLSRFEFLLVS
ncbi:MAG: hypothetical protein AB7P76_13235, partial [Candidatus Melainabacteria bacterium]